ncbi:MAG: DUF1566 domain-containing protein [Bacteroidia bacterium]|nr:DUF1566 domain-containing protein [Bacteroidia bacterium]
MTLSFQFANYWSSTENNNNNAWKQNFNNGNTNNNNKNNNYRVRAVRKLTNHFFRTPVSACKDLTGVSLFVTLLTFN